MTKLLKASEVADLLNVTLQTVYQLKAAHKIPFIQFGGNIRFDEKEIEEWVKTKTTK